jgi:hypothetical protein
MALLRQSPTLLDIAGPEEAEAETALSRNVGLLLAADNKASKDFVVLRHDFAVELPITRFENPLTQCNSYLYILRSGRD